MNILGIHLGHDANAALIMNGRIVADVQEERFNRVKHSADPPKAAVAACLEKGRINIEQVDVVAFSGQRLHADVHRLLELDTGDQWEPPVYHTRYRLPARTRIRSYDHHQCHAATAFFLSPDIEPALIMVSDGFGDDCSISFWTGKGGSLQLVTKYPKEGSLGWFYSNVTEALGWIHGDGEGKTMALAAGADPSVALGALAMFCPEYQGVDLVRPRDFGKIGRLVERGAIQWHLPDAYEIRKLLESFSPEELAAAAQELLERNHLTLCSHWLKKTSLSRLCLSGGVFLNIILNRHLSGLLPQDRLFVTPNPADSGLGLGAALCALSEFAPHQIKPGLPTPYLGPGFSDEEIMDFLNRRKLAFRQVDEHQLCRTVAEALADNRCVGWFQGSMESGPRALGNRSILMSPLRAEHQEYINRNVKYREPFRPFCPSILEEDRNRYIEQGDSAPYMILAFSTPPDIRKAIGAVVHSDGTIRPQVVSANSNPRFHRLLLEFRKLTGEGILLNTSFNIKGEPIVCTPADAVRCFYSSGMDMLVLGTCIVTKEMN